MHLDDINYKALATNPFFIASIAPRFTYYADCYDADGALKWSDDGGNLVTTQGKNDILDKFLAGTSYTAAWYLGLKGTGSPSASDTLASHSWSEVTAYAGNRPSLSFSSASGGTKAATAVTYTINAAATIAGLFVASAATGGSGILYSVADLGATRSMDSGDTLVVNFSASMA